MQDVGKLVRKCSVNIVFRHLHACSFALRSMKYPTPTLTPEVRSGCVRQVDCTSYYELEQQEYARKGVSLTPDLWMMKLMVGAVDRSYDEQVPASPWPLWRLLCFAVQTGRQRPVTPCIGVLKETNQSAVHIPAVLCRIEAIADSKTVC
jgi:hypothetical protein